jgi:glycosidase
VKARFPDDILICECDLAPRDAIPWLLGNELDGVMNYRWRQYVLDFFGRGAGGGGVSSVVTFYKSLMSMLEEYPLPAIYSSMNLVDSHDTDRITSVMPTKQEQEIVAAFQMTWIGAPTIYYGDEAGLIGANSDPERRRPFPWDHPDTGLQNFYKLVIGIRNANPALRDGSVSPLVLDNNHRVLAFLRRDSAQSVAVVFSDDTSSHTVTLKLPSIANGTQLTDAMAGNENYTIKNHRITVKLASYTTAILVQKTK